MSCQCYQIGGPFISEDPNCPRHGSLAATYREEVRVWLERAMDPATSTEDRNALISRAISQIDAF